MEKKIFFNKNGINPKIKIDNIKEITPPNLLGIERKIVYANKKYHSGWIWIGVINELARIKFSGSFNKNGYCKFINFNKKIKIINPIKSFNVK